MIIKRSQKAFFSCFSRWKGWNKNIKIFYKIKSFTKQYTSRFTCEE